MENNVFVAKDLTTNPAPLGLVGFGLTTMLLNLHNAGLFGLDTMIMGMGIMRRMRIPKNPLQKDSLKSYQFS